MEPGKLNNLVNVFPAYPYFNTGGRDRAAAGIVSSGAVLRSRMGVIGKRTNQCYDHRIKGKNG